MVRSPCGCGSEGGGGAWGEGKRLVKPALDLSCSSSLAEDVSAAGCDSDWVEEDGMCETCPRTCFFHIHVHTYLQFKNQFLTNISHSQNKLCT